MSMDPAGEEAETTTLRQLIRADQLDALRRNILVAIPVNLVIAAIALVVSFHSLHGLEGAVWFAAVGLVNAIRIAQAWRPTAQRSKEPPLSPAEVDRSLNRLCLTALLSGLVWALVPVLCDGYTSPQTLFFLTIVCGITAGAITHGTPYARMPACFILPPLLSVVGCLLYAGGFDRNCLALTALIYAAALIRFAWESEAAFCETSRLKNQAMTLASSLEEAHSQAILVAQQMSHRATHDDLTGLLNRAGFIRKITSRIGRGVSPFCLMLLDLDGFRSVNDTFGHHSGDRVLIEIARRLSETLRGAFTTARLGADEFAIFYDATSTDTPPAELATRLITAIAMPLATFDAGRLSACIGLYIGDACNVTELLTRADEALLAAKSAGRSQFHIFDERLRARLEIHRDIERNLPRALADGTPEVWYQPLLGYDGQKVVSLEALLRWNHPEHGPIPPQEIISTAALSGLAEPLLRYILSNVCLMIQELRTHGQTGTRVALNISPREISRLAIDEIVFSELAQRGCPNSMLEIEITEETALDIRSVQDKLLRLARGGVQIAIDDFGVGYSTLATLRQSYVNKIKIDRSFVKDIAKSNSNQILVQSILNLGQSLGLQVVAEGVETEDDAACLRRLGCGLMQGHYFMPPIRFAEILDQLEPRRETKA
jgi:diguanylate cyclase (GGDEF)-like protein